MKVVVSSASVPVSTIVCAPLVATENGMLTAAEARARWRYQAADLGSHPR